MVSTCRKIKTKIKIKRGVGGRARLHDCTIARLHKQNECTISWSDNLKKKWRKTKKNTAVSFKLLRLNSFRQKKDLCLTYVWLMLVCRAISKRVWRLHISRNISGVVDLEPWPNSMFNIQNCFCKDARTWKWIHRKYVSFLILSLIMATEKCSTNIPKYAFGVIQLSLPLTRNKWHVTSMTKEIHVVRRPSSQLDKSYFFHF